MEFKDFLQKQLAIELMITKKAQNNDIRISNHLVEQICSNFDLKHLDANQPWFILNVSQLSARVLIALLFRVPRNHPHF